MFCRRRRSSNLFGARGIVPQDHIFGTEFHYKASGEIDTIIRATAGYGKVAVLNQCWPNTFMVPIT